MVEAAGPAGAPGGATGLERAGAGAYRPVPPPALASAAVAGEAQPPAPVVDLRGAWPSPYAALGDLIDGQDRRDTVELPVTRLGRRRGRVFR